MSGPLLSRFDLVYLLLDRPDEARDRQLSEHLVALRSGARRPSQKQFVAISIVVLHGSALT